MKTRVKAKPAIISYEKMSRTKSFLYAILGFAVLLVVWQTAVLVFPKFGKMFPGPVEIVIAVVKALYTPIGKMTLIPHLLVTLSRIFVGYAIGGALGIVIGLAMGSSKAAHAIINPIFSVLKPIPSIAWIPLAILWFGIGEKSKYFIVGISTFIICVLNATAGAQRTNKNLIGAAKMLGASDRQLFFKVVLPSAIPQIFAGLQIALSGACSTILAAEMIRSSEGAGWLIVKGMDTGNMTQIMVGIIAISVTGMILAIIMRAIERRAIAWNNRGR